MVLQELISIMKKYYDNSIPDYNFFMELIDNCIVENKNNPFDGLSKDYIERCIRGTRDFSKPKLMAVLGLRSNNRLCNFIKNKYSKYQRGNMEEELSQKNSNFTQTDAEFEFACEELFFELIQKYIDQKSTKHNNKITNSSIVKNKHPKQISESNTQINKERIINNSYYNLFVSHRANLDTKNKISFTLDKKRILNYTNSIIKEEFSTLSDDVIEKIKHFPSVLANENTSYHGQTDENQKLAVGWVKDIKVGKDGITVTFEIKSYFSQQKFSDSPKLELKYTGGLSELNQEHWSIKNTDLISVLSELGFKTDSLY